MPKWRALVNDKYSIDIEAESYNKAVAKLYQQYDGDISSFTMSEITNGHNTATDLKLDKIYEELAKLARAVDRLNDSFVEYFEGQEELPDITQDDIKRDFSR